MKILHYLEWGRNILFQLVWFAIKGLIPRKFGNGSKLTHYAPRLIIQLLLAWCFGGPALALAGDSNSELFSRLNIMRRFHQLTVSLGIGGTRADNWEEFFNTWQGKVVLFLIGDARTVWNIAGNNALQKVVEKTLPALKSIHELTPGSFCIMIPPIFFDRLGIIAAPDALRNDVSLINHWISQEWGNHAIDPAPLVDKDKDGNPDEGTIRDGLVHYADRIIFQLQTQIQEVAV